MNGQNQTLQKEIIIEFIAEIYEQESVRIGLRVVCGFVRIGLSKWILFRTIQNQCLDDGGTNDGDRQAQNDFSLHQTVLSSATHQA